MTWKSTWRICATSSGNTQSAWSVRSPLSGHRARPSRSSPSNASRFQDLFLQFRRETGALLEREGGEFLRWRLGPIEQALTQMNGADLFAFRTAFFPAFQAR